jgi:hypothetical protein
MMANFKKMYMKLFNSITDAVHQLQDAQAKTEAEYIEHEDVNIRFADDDENE